MRRHNLISIHIERRLNDALDESPCEAYPSDMQFRCPNGLGACPDVSVACDPLFEDEREDTLLNPIVIFDVISRPTEACDSGRKFDSHCGLSSHRVPPRVAESTID